MGLFILFAVLVGAAMVAMIIWNNTPRRHTVVYDGAAPVRRLRSRRINLIDPEVTGATEETVVETRRRRVNGWD